MAASVTRVAVNLLAALDERFGPDALSRALAGADAAGYTVGRVDGNDDRLAAWIDLTFPGSFWSSEVRAGGAWVARRGEEIAGFAGFGARGLRFTWLRRWSDRADVGIFGPYGVATAHRGSGVGAALLTAAMCSLRERGFAQALIPAVAGERLIATYVERTGAQIVDEFEYDVGRFRTTILASGAGTNARNVLERVRDGALPLDVAAIVANDGNAGALDVARVHDVAAVPIMWERNRESRAAFDARLIDAVASTEPQLVLLLGWMHLLPAEFLTRFPETINLHPSYLPFDPAANDVVVPDGTVIPALRGAHALRDALRLGLTWTGATVHRVTSETDRGTVFVRIPLAIGGIATEVALRERIRPLEFAAVGSAIRRWTFER
jgi:phosphoribosylglycinamide formyltransferase 1